MKPVTIWRRDGAHNHIEDGHSASDAPTPRTKHQFAAWRGVQWGREYAYLDGVRIVAEPVAAGPATCTNPQDIGRDQGERACLV